ncbi:hypothetical protein IL306_013394 [Fusarium sp. DS 682]|nr:hypothetical protein IL306_013394 [Fusarium sp. DS 682]
MSNDVASASNLEEYLRDAPDYRRQLEDLLPPGFNPAEEIKNNHDVMLTYLGYKKFLDLEMQKASPGESISSLKDRMAMTAKNMIRRDKAYAEAIRRAYPDAIRLSIHESNDNNKISIPVLPLASGHPMTPWHGALVRAVNGDVTMMVRPAREDLEYSLQNVDMTKLRELSHQCSPVILRGFKDTRHKSVFVAKAKEMGSILPLKEGDIIVVKDQLEDAPDADVTTTSEAMPMHYDGMFRFKIIKDDQGREEITSDPPLLQLFVCQVTAGRNEGFTLFASSHLFCRYLPDKYHIDSLRNIRWTCNSSGYFDHRVPSLPLVVSHPVDSQPCIRWHETWPQEKTKFGAATITIDNGDQSIVALVDTLLHDERVCLRFTWEVGDVVVNDNVKTLHTRTAFQRGADRELWRIHVN